MMNQTTDPDDWLRRAQELIAARPKDEASKSHNMNRINMLLHELDDEQARATPETGMAKARLAQRVNDLDAALERWRDCITRWPETANEAQLHIAEIHLKRSEFAQAKSLMASAAAIDHPDYRRVRRALDAGRRLLGSSRKYRSALIHFGKARMEDFRRASVAALTGLHGESLATHPQILALIDDLSDGPASTLPLPDLPHEPQGEAPVAIFAAGFGWSGSGAIFDFLRQHRDAKVFSTSEMTFFASAEGDIYKCLKALEDNPSNFPNMLCRSVLHGVLGLSKRGTKNLLYARKARNRSLLSICEGDPGRINELIVATRQLVRRLRELPLDGSATAADFRAATTIFIDGLFRRQGTGRRFLLFSNAINGYAAGNIRALPENCRVVACVRDARDAYADRFMCGYRTPVQAFIDNFRLKREKFQVALSDPSVAGRVIEVRFEEMMRDSGARRQLLERLGMDPSGLVEDAALFDPRKSAKNIGIHADFAGRGSIERIARELPMYLHGSA